MTLNPDLSQSKAMTFLDEVFMKTIERLGLSTLRKDVWETLKLCRNYLQTSHGLSRSLRPLALKISFQCKKKKEINRWNRMIIILSEQYNSDCCRYTRIVPGIFL